MMFNLKNLFSFQEIEPLTRRKFYLHLFLGIIFAGLTIFLFAQLAKDLFLMN